ncbi:DUF1120 domain-containing protein [Enterobacter mori]|uniref:DUF1120 domain-containing protein n=1 Tax=Enterobacter mori TaxID=539813 RepID=UPI002ED5845A|nr:DUF1120 domain-containing protein [Enterobacter mori]
MYMKKELTLILAVVICPFITGSAMAAGTADMSVGGTVITGSCTPTLSASTVDYGTIDVSRLTSTDENAGNRLGFRDITLNVTCDSPMKVAWGATDNRAGTAAYLNSDVEIGTEYAPAYYFGLGDTPEGKHIGSYSITVTEPGSTVDGGPANILTQINTSTTWADLNNQNGTTGNVYKAGTLSWILTVSSPGTLEPMAATTVSYALSISAQVDMMSNLNLTDDTVLDGSATFTLVYL